ncbi:MAG: biotin/lipoate A/B protein ligase family protein [Candidatus Bruticola sp.]
MEHNFLESYAALSWQYIIDAPLSGAENMERDLCLMKKCTMPILRLYDWVRPTLSLGRNQNDQWIDRELCRRLQVDIVRRPTGGRALLHMPGEITYAVILPGIDNRLKIVKAFSDIAAVLGKALYSLGLPVSTSQDGHVPSGVSHPSCMSVTAPGEITALGRKFVGSAQVRQGSKLLQHGVIVRAYDIELLREIIPEAEPGVDLVSLGFADLKPQTVALAFKEVLAKLK